MTCLEDHNGRNLGLSHIVFAEHRHYCVLHRATSGTLSRPTSEAEDPGRPHVRVSPISQPDDYAEAQL
ncbi:hypothetical protein C8034_v007929 [Colletotrichum sidae]|uniref:Uncharacterized protein n=1 Tax=Colletotrichum sidae TaxID=1347389 RepID=A0A4R8T310_9PEZI|nr:hypothetical protein C8034_v007929 [Colletotrichum sidae]